MSELRLSMNIISSRLKGELPGQFLCAPYRKKLNPPILVRH
jgi:hypothetical protein